MELFILGISAGFIIVAIARLLLSFRKSAKETRQKELESYVDFKLSQYGRIFRDADKELKGRVEETENKLGLLQLRLDNLWGLERRVENILQEAAERKNKREERMARRSSRQ